MTELRRRMIEDMQLRGLTSKTRDSYVAAVKTLSQHPERVNKFETRCLKN